METYMKLSNFDIIYQTEFDPLPKNAVFVDENIAPILSILNKKGYTTQYSCEGHYYDKGFFTYISFMPWVKLDSVPLNFNFEAEGNCIRYNYNHEYDLYREVYDNPEHILKFNTLKLMILGNILDWAKELPDYHAVDECREIKHYILTYRELHNHIFTKYITDDSINALGVENVKRLNKTKSIKFTQTIRETNDMVISMLGNAFTGGYIHSYEFENYYDTLIKWALEYATKGMKKNGINEDTRFHNKNDVCNKVYDTLIGKHKKKKESK